MGALAKSFQTQVAKGVKVEKVSASLGDTLRTRLERVRGVSPVLRSGG